MNVLYDSGSYYVTEFPGCGIELVDKRAGRGGYLDGALELHFRAGMAHLFAAEPSDDTVDEFLGGFQALLTNPMVFH